VKAGDLIALKMKKTHPPQVPSHAIILSTRPAEGDRLTIDVLWDNGHCSQCLSAELFEVINESR